MPARDMSCSQTLLKGAVYICRYNVYKYTKAKEKTCGDRACDEQITR